MHGLRSKYKRESEGLCIRAEDLLPGDPSPFAYPEDGRTHCSQKQPACQAALQVERDSWNSYESATLRLSLAQRHAVWRLPIR